MKIVSLQAENFKRLTAVEITPTGNVVEITGKNGQGKTSVLDAIWVALAGLSFAPRKPIRKGQEEAHIRLDLGEIVVTRTFKIGKDGETTSAIRVENAEGAKYPSPQTMLDKLLGQLSFDPLAFARMDARAQFDTLRVFVKDFDFKRAADDSKADYDLRTAVNRKAREARDAAAMIKVDPAMPAHGVDPALLVAKLDDAGKHNADIETRKANRQRMNDEIVRLRNEADAEEKNIKVMEEKIEQARSLMARYRSEADEKADKLAAAGPLPEPIDTAAIRAEIAAADRINAAVRDRARREQLIVDAQLHEQQASDLTAAIERREEEKRAAIAAAKLPVEGITFGDGFLLLNDVPFSQASDAEQLRASLAMAMAMNPKLKVIRVRDGSLLDDDSMRLIAAMADAQDYQVWIERVDSSGKVGIVLEDGHIKPTGESE